MAEDESHPDGRDQEPGSRRRRRWWRRSAGVAVTVAVMVAAAGNAAGVTPRRPTSGEIAVVAAEPADGPVHGEFPVVAADGSVQTRRWQWGEVVEVRPTTDPSRPVGITVASQDGYAGDYVLAADQLAGLAVGDVVTVVGVVPPRRVPARPEVR